MALPFGPPENIFNVEDAQKWMSDLYSWVISPESSDGPNFLASGTGATVRTVQDKLRDLTVLSDFDSVSNAIAATPSGGILWLNEGTHTVSGNITIASPITIFGYGATLSWASDTSANRGLKITSSNVSIYGLGLDGPQHASAVSSQAGLLIYGADASHYISNIGIYDCVIHDWGYTGIRATFVSDFRFERNQIYDVVYEGIAGLSIIRGWIQKNKIYDVNVDVGGANAYGIYLSRTEDDSLTTCPRSADVLVSHNYISDVDTWTGLDTHGGQRITFDGNIVINCPIGIGVGESDNGSNVATFPPYDIIISNNTFEWPGATEGTGHTGCNFAGVENDHATGRIVGNSFYHMGSDGDSGNAAAINCYHTIGLVIQGNLIRKCAQYGVRLNHQNTDVNINGNDFIDLWADTGTMSAGIYSESQYNTGIISGNVFHRTGDQSAKDHDFEYGINIADQTGTFLTVGDNRNEGIKTYITDAGYRSFRGIFEDSSTSGTGEDVLHSFTLPRYFLGKGNRITLFASGKNTGANGNKSVVFYFGAASSNAIPDDNNQDEWTITVNIYVTLYNAQRIHLVGTRASGNIVVDNYFDGTVDLHAGDTLVKFTGTCADASDTITQYITDIRID